MRHHDHPAAGFPPGVAPSRPGRLCGRHVGALATSITNRVPGILNISERPAEADDGTRRPRREADGNWDGRSSRATPASPGRRGSRAIAAGPEARRIVQSLGPNTFAGVGGPGKDYLIAGWGHDRLYG